MSSNSSEIKHVPVSIDFNLCMAPYRVVLNNDLHELARGDLVT